MNKRVVYLIATFALLFTEVMIALFAHDSFIRPYVGDMLVVIVIYMFIRIWMPDKCRILPLYVFLFAVLVEVLQYFNIVEMLGLSESKFFSILIGGTFDWKDIACYGAGCVVLVIYEIISARRRV
ncbi:MAG: DUF2809 domain-containing protein [Clostridium sp.]|nr:DUF2809 domain-containing protein [Clostridium sp.]MCM1172932.1 DUF2809 domain-containing protein [Clostridium sp.]MCM1209518.1 DUF2809 domain-containing protein [Ruminococcus sp.]